MTKKKNSRSLKTDKKYKSSAPSFFHMIQMLPNINDVYFKKK